MVRLRVLVILMKCDYVYSLAGYKRCQKITETINQTMPIIYEMLQVETGSEDKWKRVIVASIITLSKMF